MGLKLFLKLFCFENSKNTYYAFILLICDFTVYPQSIFQTLNILAIEWVSQKALKISKCQMLSKYYVPLSSHASRYRCKALSGRYNSFIQRKIKNSSKKSLFKESLHSFQADISDYGGFPL